MKTIIVNIEHFSDFTVYIGRPSKWGNPFIIGVHGNRKEVIEKYKIYLLSTKRLMDDIMLLDGAILGCHCKPKACHGDIIIETIELIKLANQLCIR